VGAQPTEPLVTNTLDLMKVWCLSILNISCYAIPGQWDFVIEKNSIYSDFE
jgi:hypothetical protein